MKTLKINLTTPHARRLATGCVVTALALAMAMPARAQEADPCYTHRIAWDDQTVTYQCLTQTELENLTENSHVVEIVPVRAYVPMAGR